MAYNISLGLRREHGDVQNLHRAKKVFPQICIPQVTRRPFSQSSRLRAQDRLHPLPRRQRCYLPQQVFGRLGSFARSLHHRVPATPDPCCCISRPKKVNRRLRHLHFRFLRVLPYEIFYLHGLHGNHDFESAGTMCSGRQFEGEGSCILKHRWRVDNIQT